MAVAEVHIEQYEVNGSAVNRAADRRLGDGRGTDFVLGIIPATLFSSFTSGSILQILLVALLVGFALQGLGEKGTSTLEAIKKLQALVFRILSMVLWLAPIGAFGAIAAVVGNTGGGALLSLATLLVGFYIRCAVFIIVVLGSLLRVVTGVNIFSKMKYLGREYLLIGGTSSSEAALPRLISKTEHLGVSKSVVGITVPTGYSFDLDGTAIYLTMASLFIANAMGKPLEIGAQVGLLAFMIIASKGAAGVTGAGLATLAGGLQTYRPDLVNGVGVIVGIDRFMSEARAVTNFTGNAVATLLIGPWTRQIDVVQVRAALSSQRPYPESMLATTDGHDASTVRTTTAITVIVEGPDRQPVKTH